jgi:peptide/nickel transport system substrate-binding protein
MELVDPDRGLTRRKLIVNGARGSAALALGPLLLPNSAVGSTVARMATGKIKKGGTLTFARSVAPTQLDPANSIVQGDVYTLDKIFEPLYITSPGGKLTPWLATGYKTSHDYKTWTFHLRPGVRFNDGTPLTAEDVAWSIERAATDKEGPLSFLDTAIKKISASGTNAVVITLSEAWAPFLSDISVFANAILPKKFGGKTEKAFFANPVGTGPFMLPSWKADSDLTLKANPHYWQPGKPYVDEVQIKYVDSDNQRVLQLTGGQVDIIDTVPPANVASLKARSGIKLSEFPSWAVDLLILNEQLPQFKDVQVRRAISHAIDRKSLVDATSFGTSKPGGSFFPPSLQYYDPDTPYLAYSPKAAKQALAQSKYPKGFATKLLVDSGNETYVEFAQIIQSQLSKIDINVSITTLDHAAFESTFQKYDFDMFIDGATNDISDPDEMASFNLDYVSGGSKSFWSSYDNPKVIKLIHEAEVEPSSAKRAKLYSEIQKIAAQDVPFVPLDYPPNIYATSDSVHGFAVNPGGAYRLEDVWIS